MLIINPLKGLFFFFQHKKREERNYSNDKEQKNEYLKEKIRKLEEIIKEEATKTEKLKSQFLNNIYHEIRTPMNSIIGFSELLQQNDISDNKKKLYIDSIRESSEDFLNILDQLLEASIIESGNIQLMKENFELDGLINEIYNLFNYHKHLKNKTQIAFLKVTDKYYPGLSIHSDPIRIRQILYNLIDNAFKFTQKGVIEFGYKIIDNQYLLFYVKDSGSGINKSDESLIFQNFYKSSFCNGSANKGLGLGLCIAKNLVKILGGKIWIESNNFQGTTFKFTLPIERPFIGKEHNKSGVTEMKKVFIQH